MGLIKLFVFGFLFLSVIYLSVSVYSRSVRRERLEKRWDAENPDGGDLPARTTYIETGMAKYESGFRKRLIVLIYIIPTVAVAVILYLNNAN
jgi:hypothetical protein